MADVDIHAAQLLAKYGRKFTEIETMLHAYFRELDEVSTIDSGGKSKYQIAMDGVRKLTPEDIAEQAQMLRGCVDRDRARLFEFFISAIDTRDSRKIFEIAKAVDRLKANKEVGDRYRSELLSLKRVMDITKNRLPIGLVAKLIGWPHEGNADGYSQLRRLCKGLNLPLASSRQIKLK